MQKVISNAFLSKLQKWINGCLHPNCFYFRKDNLKYKIYISHKKNINLIEQTSSKNFFMCLCDTICLSVSIYYTCFYHYYYL